MPSAPQLAFVSYCHKDKRWLERLLIHLKPLEQAGKVVAWEDTRIRAGQEWKTEIATAMEAARVAILLVSPDFLASEFITTNELPRLLAAAKTRGLVIIPVIVSPCRYEQTPQIASLQSVNPPSKPLSRLGKPQAEEYFVKLSIQIEGALAVDQQAKETSAGSPSAVTFPSIRPRPYPGEIHTTRSSSALQGVTSDHVGENVPLFSLKGKQWAVIIGTQPKFLSEDHWASTEFFDASDILDWFWSPDVYGPIPTDQLFFLVAAGATSETVFWALGQIADRIQPDDSVLLYYSGHATEFSDPGELVLYDAFEGGTWGQVTKDVRGILTASFLMDWSNRIAAEKVVCLLDSGGPACYKASNSMRGGRYIISALNSWIGGRNGWITWYLRRIVQKYGPSTSVAQVYEILRQGEEMLSKPLHVYLRGRDSERPYSPRAARVAEDADRLNH